MRACWMLVGWLLLVAMTVSAAEGDAPAAGGAGSPDAPAAAPDAPVAGDDAAAEEPPPAAQGYDWTQLETIKRWQIQNAKARIEVTSWRGAIRRFWILDAHPIPIPEWRGGTGEVEKDADGEPVALSVLDEFNPITPELERAFMFATLGHNYVGSMGLIDDDGSPAEGPWQEVAHTSDALTIEAASADGTRVYRLTYRMDPVRPTVHVQFTIHNKGPQAIEGHPTLISINGIHQDDPRNEAWDLKLIGAFDTDAEEEAFTFEKWSLPDPLTKRFLQHPQLQEPAIPAGRVAYLGIKSRFFTAFWEPGPVRVVGADSQPVTQTGSGDLGDMMDVGSGVVSGSDDYLITAMAFGYEQPFGATEKARQAWIGAKLFAPGGTPFQIGTGQRLEATWSITCSGMREHDLALLTPAEQRIEYTDAWYNFFKILVNILTVVLDAVVWVVGNYGVAVLIFVIMVKGLLHKLNVKQQKGMANMQRMAPKLKELQERYKHDRQTLARKQMEMMRDEGVNPMGGCLPLLIQMPIFFAMFQTFRHYAPMREHGFLWVDDLTMPDQWFHLFTLPFNMPFFGQDVTFNLLPLLYIAIMCFSSFSNKIPDDAPDQQKQMAKMMRWLPIIFGVVCYNFPAGLLLYMCMSALIGTLEMKYIRKKYGTTGVQMPA